MLLSRDRSPSWIFTRFLTAARRAIDARQLYGHERDVFTRLPLCSLMNQQSPTYGYATKFT